VPRRDVHELSISPIATESVDNRVGGLVGGGGGTQNDLLALVWDKVERYTVASCGAELSTT
jgi:hypothetical protein